MRALAVLFWLLMQVDLAFAAEPFAQATIDAGRIVPGQQVHVAVEVFVPDFFTSPPQFPLFSLPNAVVTLPDERAQNLMQTIDGVQYSGIRRTYAVVPEVSATFTLPPVSIELGYSVDGKSVKGSVQLPSVSFNVIAPAGSERQTIVFAARHLTLTQSFDRNPSRLKVGDAVVRTLTIFAEDTQAMMIPPVDIGQAAGLRQYRKPPKIADNVAVGRLNGSERAETIVYTADAAGSFQIPAISYPWFDVEAHQASTATLPPITVAVSEAPASSDAIVPEMQSGRTQTTRIQPLALAVLASGCAALVAAIWTGRHLLLRLMGGLRIRRDPKRAEFKRLIKSIARDDESAVYRSLARWAKIMGYSSISAWTTVVSDPVLESQIRTLEGALFGRGTPGTTLDRRTLADAVRRSRIIRHATRRALRSALPPLNPQ